MTDSILPVRSTQWSTLVRVILFWLAYLAILFFASQVKDIVPRTLGQLAWGLASGVAIFLLSLCFLRREGRRTRDVGLDLDGLSLPKALLGFALGVAVFGLELAAVRLFVAPIRFDLAASVDPPAVGLIICTHLATSWMEELGFRGYPLRTLFPAFTMWQAQGMVALAFGLSHVAFGWAWSSIVLGVIPCGVLFGMVAIASRGPAMPTGVHAG